MYTNIRIQDVIIQATIGQYLTFWDSVDSVQVLGGNEWVVKLLVTTSSKNPVDVIQNLDGYTVFNYTVSTKPDGSKKLTSTLEGDYPVFTLAKITVSVKPKNNRLPKTIQELEDIIYAAI